MRIFQDDAAGAAAAPGPLTDADLAAIAELEARGGRAVTLAQNDARLDVSLHLGDAVVDAATFDVLAKLSDRLHELNLRGRSVDDALARKLTLLPNLARLHLENTQVTDAALVPVGTLEKLEYLNLYGTKVTDAGLPSLRGLTSLERLYLWDTAVTPAGVLTLRESLPDCEFVGIDLPKPPREPLVAPRPKPKDDA